MKITMVSDIVSPFCWIAANQINQAIKAFPEQSFDLVLQPFKVTPNLPEIGITFKQYQQQHLTQTFGSMANVQQVLMDVKKLGQQVACDFHFERLEHWPNTTKAHGLWLLADKENQWALHNALCQAHFEMGLNLGDISVLEQIGIQHGLKINHIHNKLTDPIYLKSVEKLMTQSHTRGIHSVPNILIGNTFQISGAKDVATLIDAIKNTQLNELSKPTDNLSNTTKRGILS